MNFILKNRLLAALALYMIALVPLLGMFSGCASKLQGDQMQNEPPQVGFINSPPESTNFSRNTVIYWWGTDTDGIIDYFRYHVAPVTQLGTNTPDQYIAGLADSNDAWTIVDVDIVNSDPGTEKIIKLSADLSDPVNTFVLQYVFLQAFDEEGEASTIVYRLFGRNDNPPNTIIFSTSANEPFVNAVSPGGIITGVKIQWAGTDFIDYPADPPPFDFNYRLYGPFDSVQYAQITSQFFVKRYLTATGKIYKIGDTIVTCDTTVIFPQQITCDTLPNGDTTTCDTITLPPDTTINCTSLIITSATPVTAFGGLQDHFDIANANYQSAFPDSPYCVFESENPLDSTDVWVQRTADTLFNVFRYFPKTGPADTTIEQYFVFWVRSRDDALVPDLIPAFKGVRVLNPRYERGVLIVDLSTVPSPNKAWANSYNNFGNKDTVAFTFWYNTIKKWSDVYGDPSLYLDTVRLVSENQRPDYYQVGRNPLGTVPIAWLLKHKLVIVYSEGITRPNFNAVGPNIYKAIDAGVNVWVTVRSLGGNAKNQPFTIEPMGLNYARYFGVSLAIYSGWGCHAKGARGDCPESRIEDFIGAFAKTGWPEIAVDTFRLHYKLRWALPSDSTSGNYPAFGWIVGQPNYGLPEVGWSVRTFGTELLYRYKSFYGNAHPRGRGADYDFIFEGAPCGHRLNAGLYRTVHMNFTPLVLDTIGGQAMVDSILNWLYDPTLGKTSLQFDKPRYPEATLQISLEEARENYRRRIEEYELLNATKQESFDGTEY